MQILTNRDESKPFQNDRICGLTRLDLSNNLNHLKIGCIGDQRFESNLLKSGLMIPKLYQTFKSPDLWSPKWYKSIHTRFPYTIPASLLNKHFLFNIGNLNIINVGYWLIAWITPPIQFCKKTFLNLVFFLLSWFSLLSWFFFWGIAY
jgi:hypothetical protein